MDPIAAVVSIALVVGAVSRQSFGRGGSFTHGLWAAALAVGVAAVAIPIDRPLEDATGLGNLAQMSFLVLIIISSYLIAQMTYHVARIDSPWPAIFTAMSLTSAIALYLATDLHQPAGTGEHPWIEASPGTGSAWLAVAAAIGLLPTHVAAVIGVLKIRQPDNLMMWLLGLYGVVGALYPLLVVADHVGTDTVRWDSSVFYPLVWAILLISFGALASAGSLGAFRVQRENRSSNLANV